MRNSIKETIKDITYTHGARVATVEQIISRADDCAKIGEFYFRLSDHYRRLEDEITDEERGLLEKEIAEIKLKIAEYTAYLGGYEN